MSEPLLLFTSDWHVRKYDRVWGNHHELAGDTAYGIKQILEHADHYGVKHMLLGGDNFDEKLQRSDAATLMCETMDACQQRNLAVWYVQGQHELTDPPFVNGVHSWPTHINKRTITIDGVRIYGLDYQRHNKAEEALGAIPADTDVLLTHQVWKDIMGDDRGEVWARWIPYPMWILSGDYHQRHVAEWACGNGDWLHYFSTGPLCKQDIGAPNEHWAMLVYSDFDIVWLPLKSRPYREIHIETEEVLVQVLDSQLDELLSTDERLPVEIRRPIIRVYYRTDVDQCRTRLATAIGNNAFLFWEPRVIVAEPTDMDAAIRIETVMTGGLPAIIRQSYNDDPTAASNAIRLLDAPDSKRAIQEIFDEMTGAAHGRDQDREGPLQEPGQGESREAGGDTHRRRPSLRR